MFQSLKKCLIFTLFQMVFVYAHSLFSLQLLYAKSGAAILTYTFLKYTLSLCTKVYLILGVCTKVYLKNLATLDADTKVYLE